MIQKPRSRSRAIPYPARSPAREAVLALLAGFAFLAAAAALLAPQASGQVFSSQPYVAAPDPAVEALRNRLNALETELRATIDRNEKLAYDLAQVRRSAENASKAAEAEIAELKSRIEALEAGGAAGGGPADASLTRGDVTVTGSLLASSASNAAVDLSQLPQDEEGLLKESNELLLRKELAAAQQSAEAFLAKYSKSKDADEAQYILAEALLYQDNYADAATAYGKVVSQYPKSDKAPYSLVKLARAMRLMDKKTEACKSLELMAKQYPNAPSNAKSLATTERRNANCK
jgi:tol-pal system protein YbgF